jgi:hypothetical protein
LLFRGPDESFLQDWTSVVGGGLGRLNALDLGFGHFSAAIAVNLLAEPKVGKDLLGQPPKHCAGKRDGRVSTKLHCTKLSI